MSERRYTAGRPGNRTAVQMFAAAVGTLALAVAEAGLLDSPPPSFDGALGRVVYRMGPVQYAPGEADTIISCTSAESRSIGVAVEIFDEGDLQAGLTARAQLAPGASVRFVTSTAVAAPSAAASAVVIPGLVWVERGKARISATSDRIACTAVHRYRARGGVQESVLELIKRVQMPVSTAR
jgi:hypothetical protein